MIVIILRRSDKKVIQRKIIIDTDAGADDALAILLALRYEALHPKEFKVLAITCVYGNAHLENVSENVLKTLTVANRSDVSILRLLCYKSILSAKKNSSS